jgi:hypothetical protein
MVRVGRPNNDQKIKADKSDPHPPSFFVRLTLSAGDVEML